MHTPILQSYLRSIPASNATSKMLSPSATSTTCVSPSWRISTFTAFTRTTPPRTTDLDFALFRVVVKDLAHTKVLVRAVSMVISSADGVLDKVRRLVTRERRRWCVEREYKGERGRRRAQRVRAHVPGVPVNSRERDARRSLTSPSRAGESSIPFYLYYKFYRLQRTPRYLLPIRARTGA